MRKDQTQIGSSDVTEFSLFGQKLNFSPTLDLHNGYLVCHTIADDRL